MARDKEKYYKLRQYLSDAKETVLIMSFSETEEILGFQLNASAYKYPAIWSNSDSHRPLFSEKSAVPRRIPPGSSGAGQETTFL